MSGWFCSYGPLGRLSRACWASSSPDHDAPRLPKFLGATWTSQRSFCPHKESREGQPTEVALSEGRPRTWGARSLTLPRRVCWPCWGQCGASRRQSSQSPSLAGLKFKAGSKITLDIMSGETGRVKKHCQVSALPSSRNLSPFLKRHSRNPLTLGGGPGRGHELAEQGQEAADLTQNVGLATGILSTPQIKPARGQGDITRDVTFQRRVSTFRGPYGHEAF